MNAQFQPKRADGRPIWRVVYDDVQSRLKGGSLKLGGLIPDSELTALLDDEEHPQLYAAALRAAKELERTEHRTLVRDRGKGYRLTGGLGQVERSDNYKKQSHRRLKRSFELVTTTDHGLLSSDDRSAVDKKTRAIGVLLLHAKMTDEKLAAQDEQMKELRQQVVTSSSRQSATDEEVAELKRRLEELESKSPRPG